MFSLCLAVILSLLFGLQSVPCSATSANNTPKRIDRTSPPNGALVVRRSGARSGEFSSIAAAVAALASSSAASIFIYPGVYRESVYIQHSKPLTIYGYTTDTSSYAANQVVLTTGRTATEAGGNDASAALRVHMDDFAIYNVDIGNTCGTAASHQQATALSAYGNRQRYYACRITGYQDTLLSNAGKQFYGKSLIAGGVDFIFGQQGVAWFDGCTLDVIGSGSITANGRDSNSNPSWFVFHKCSVTSTRGVAAGSAYLGRPWRSYARVVFQYSVFSDIVNVAGWTTWSRSIGRNEHVAFAEHGNTGPGATGSRVKFGGKLDSGLKISDILGSDYSSWVDANYRS